MNPGDPSTGRKFKIFLTYLSQIKLGTYTVHVQIHISIFIKNRMFLSRNYLSDSCTIETLQLMSFKTVVKTTVYLQEQKNHHRCHHHHYNHHYYCFSNCGKSYIYIYLQIRMFYFCCKTWYKIHVCRIWGTSMMCCNRISIQQFELDCRSHLVSVLHFL